jgi:ParB family chromosome partitioning protein
MLSLEMGGLNDEDFDLSLIGFDVGELTEIMFKPDFEPGSEDDQGRLDQKTPTTCPECGHEFEA